LVNVLSMNSNKFISFCGPWESYKLFWPILQILFAFCTQGAHAGAAYSMVHVHGATVVAMVAAMFAETVARIDCWNSECYSSCP